MKNTVHKTKKNNIYSTIEEWKYIGTNKIHTTAIISDNVEMGEGNVINPFTVIGYPGFIRDMEDVKGKIRIGNNNIIGCNVCIMSGSEGITSIGDNNLIMNYVNLGHNSEIGNNNEIGARTLIAGWVKVGNLNKIKINCTIRNRKILGDDNIVGMCSSITKDFEVDGWLIYGSPARQVKIK